MDKVQAASTYYRWIASRGTVSRDVAKYAARMFYGPFQALENKDPGAKPEKAEDILFWPLVRSGVVSYVGDDNYRISEPVHYRTLSGRVLSINDYALLARDIYCSRHPGIDLLSDKVPQESSVLDFDLSKFLPLLPELSIFRLIEKLPISSGVDFPYEVYPSKGPVHSSRCKDSPSILSATHKPGGKRALSWGGALYEISRRNPDTLPLARLFVDIATNRSPVTFNEHNSTAKIKTYVFPTELRKLLLLESITVNDDLHQPLFENVYTLRKKAFVQLQKFLTYHP